jgi:hypothetical protein
MKIQEILEIFKSDEEDYRKKFLDPWSEILEFCCDFSSPAAFIPELKRMEEDLAGILLLFALLVTPVVLPFTTRTSIYYR